jgi:hypothetical protein
VATRRYIPALAALVVFLFFATLYLTGQRPLSDAILFNLGIDAWPFPFLDADGVVSAARCRREGLDVIADNPCDPLRRPYNYSPLWLVLAILPVTPAWLLPVGLIMAFACMAALLLLPAGRTPGATVIITLAAISPPMIFAIERANIDIVVFVLALVAATLASRTPALRLIGYGAALLAGLLKYFPITMMVMATRERPIRFLAVFLASVGVVGAFWAIAGDDILRTWQLIPDSGWTNNMMGSRTLPGGLAHEYAWPPGRAETLHVILIAASALGGVALAFLPSIAAGIDRLTEAERMALLAGAALIITCFFGARNVGYRFMFLLLTLPALTALWRLRAGWLFSVTTFTVLLLVWSQAWRALWMRKLIPGRPAFITIWVIRETLWWWTITILIGIVVAMIARSELMKSLVTGRRSKF